MRKNMRVDLGEQDGLLLVRQAIERARRVESKQGGGWVNADLGPTRDQLATVKSGIKKNTNT